MNSTFEQRASAGEFEYRCKYCRRKFWVAADSTERLSCPICPWVVLERTGEVR